ncbi:hypothetical protein GGG16DRAFT_120065, partial [Schizophyllum commune]
MQRREPEWLRESRRKDDAWEATRPQRATYAPPPPRLPPIIPCDIAPTFEGPEFAWHQQHDVRHVSQAYVPDCRYVAGAPPAHPTSIIATPNTAATAMRASDHTRIEEAPRQTAPAGTPPPARPARSAARSRPPPIPPPSTRPRARTSDTGLEDRAGKAASSGATWPQPAPTPAKPPPPPPRSTARSKIILSCDEIPADALSRAAAAQATSPGNPDRTAPTNDRHDS